MLRTPERIVIVGGGLAGVRTAESLRRLSYGGRLVLVSDERHEPYDRPPLSKAVLRGEQPSVALRTSDELAELQVELHLAQAALRLDPAGRQVRTDTGLLDYDVAVIATGALPRRVPGLDGLVLRSVDDAYAIRDQLRSAARIAVVGAGLIGCEVAASARSLDIEVHLIDMLAGPMIRVLGPELAKVVADLHVERGVRTHFEVGVGRDDQGGLTLGDGQRYDADLVLEAIGARPATDWLVDSGLALEDGVVCDEHGRASDGVYAVGDVARWAGVRNEHWTSATQQASAVAASILGTPTASDQVPYWWSDQYDLKIQGLGAPGPDDHVDVLTWGPNSRTAGLYSNQGRLTGAVGFSATRAIMSLRADIQAGTPVASVLARLAG